MTNRVCSMHSSSERWDLCTDGRMINDNAQQHYLLKKSMFLHDLADGNRTVCLVFLLNVAKAHVF